HRELDARGKLPAEALADLRLRFLPDDARGKRVGEIGSAITREVSNLADVVDQTLGLAYKTEIVLEGPAGVGAKIDGEALKAVLETSTSKTADIRLEIGILGADLRRSRATLAGLNRELKFIRAARLTDPLTGLGNERQLKGALSAAISRANKNNERLVLLLAELDRFAAFTELHGRALSERVLCLVADALRGLVPERAVLAKSNGARFAVVLATTKKDAESVLADKLRRRISRSQIVSASNGRSLGRLTLSIGATTVTAGDDPRSALNKAESRLRRAIS